MLSLARWRTNCRVEQKYCQTWIFSPRPRVENRSDSIIFSTPRAQLEDSHGADLWRGTQIVRAEQARLGSTAQYQKSGVLSCRERVRHSCPRSGAEMVGQVPVASPSTIVRADVRSHLLGEVHFEHLHVGVERAPNGLGQTARASPGGATNLPWSYPNHPSN